jgi:hypothetical protein
MLACERVYLDFAWFERQLAQVSTATSVRATSTHSNVIASRAITSAACAISATHLNSSHASRHPMSVLDPVQTAAARAMRAMGQTHDPSWTWRSARMQPALSSTIAGCAAGGTTPTESSGQRRDLQGPTRPKMVPGAFYASPRATPCPSSGPSVRIRAGIQQENSMPKLLPMLAALLVPSAAHAGPRPLPTSDKTG